MGRCSRSYDDMSWILDISRKVVAFNDVTVMSVDDNHDNDDGAVR